MPRSSLDGTLANSGDPDQTPQNTASDQDLDCLLTGISIKNKMKIKKDSRHSFHDMNASN